jgi:hypothetical protein
MKNHERAIQIWQVLIGLAHNRQTITDEKLAELIGMQDKFNELIEPFKLIINYCRLNELPPLTYLVVQKDIDIPGQSTRFIMDYDRDREDVFDFGWYNLKPIDKNVFSLFL